MLFTAVKHMLNIIITDIKYLSMRLSGSTQSKQWQIELLCRYKQTKTSRITVLNTQKLCHYFVYFKLYGYFEWSLSSPFEI